MSFLKPVDPAPPYYGSVPLVQTSSIRICTIALSGTDKIRLIGTPDPLTPLLRSAILSTWGTIQRECNFAGSHEFKLSGTPWDGQGPDTVRSRRLLSSILFTMARAGWNLLQATDVSMREHHKDTLFFEYTEPPGGVETLHEVELFAVSFHKSDRIRIISQQSPQVAIRMMELVKQAVVSQWKYGIQEEQDYCGALEIKLQGNPWSSKGDESVYARVMLAQIIANFRAEGFKLYGCIDIGEGHDSNDIESWIMRRVNASWH
ncbi:hypothetical protein BGZ51_001634 [Haplosporangium sp. Z 767]|nr:hypothetical protein BGZ50_001673 [Haplosporangium sp. Z 11]KAF9193941.1 hypothetical protein BGZ51_001634 [Haplosporangium sp. Z 767]